MAEREVVLVRASRPTLEGAGVHLRRVFGFGTDAQTFDPFLMMDDFRGDHPSKYEKGFPAHPHRGIETITYMIQGECDHADSTGSRGTIFAGDVQWMTAGSGIIHEEMPRGDDSGQMGGFQLWANLPASQKMRDPRYQGISADDIPVVRDGAADVCVIAGETAGVTGPVEDVTVEPSYFDVTVDAGAEWSHEFPEGHTVFLYLFEGGGSFGATPTPVEAGDGTLVLFGEGDRVSLVAEDEGARFLIASGAPLREPVAWRGPVVMNTQEELEQAWRDLSDGTFVKVGAQGIL